MRDVNKYIDEVTDKESFLLFMEVLLNDFLQNPKTWENNDIKSYLEAIASWTDDMEGYYENNHLPIPKDINWKVFANILLAAKIYE